MIVYVSDGNGGLVFPVEVRREAGGDCSEGVFWSLLIPAVLIVFLAVIIRPGLASWVVQDVPVGLDDVLLLFEIHLQHPFDNNKGNASL